MDLWGPERFFSVFRLAKCTYALSGRTFFFEFSLHLGRSPSVYIMVTVLEAFSVHPVNAYVYPTDQGLRVFSVVRNADCTYSLFGRAAFSTYTKGHRKGRFFCNFYSLHLSLRCYQSQEFQDWRVSSGPWLEIGLPV